MDCSHGTYQCGPPLMGQGENGAPVILVPMWCVTCGCIKLRLPEMHAGDSARASLTAGPRRVPLAQAPR